MRMSTQFTVSVQMLMLIMAFGEQKATSEILSESTGANPVMIRQLFGKLKDAGILHVSTGKGATKLAREAEDISLWDIYMAVEKYSADELFAFHPKISEGCQVGQFFKDILSPHLDDAVQAMAAQMQAVSLAQVVQEWQVANPQAAAQGAIALANVEKILKRK